LLNTYGCKGVWVRGEGIRVRGYGLEVRRMKVRGDNEG
jgi:hypothetical protein